MKAAILLLVTAAVALAAESEDTARAQVARDVWVLQMGNPTREYAVRLGALQTVTLQDYDMRRDGTLRRVVEMTIETSGGNQTRFYWEDKPETETPGPAEAREARREVARAVRDLTGEDLEAAPARVRKDYPVTTHGRWTEFKLSSEQEVVSLHSQLMETWTGPRQQP